MAPPEEPEDGTATRDLVQPIQVWYWDEDQHFASEMMYINPQDSAHSKGEPRLVVPLGSFEALSQAYVGSVEQLECKNSLLSEKEDLLSRLRIGYYKELEHLRSMLEMSRQQLGMKDKAVGLEKQRRAEAFEAYVKETDVYYFDIIDYLDSDLKAIFKDVVKQFNRDLMKENWELKDKMSLYESEDDPDLPQKMVTLLLLKGHSPAKIVGFLNGCIENEAQSQAFREELYKILGVRKEDIEQAQEQAKKSRGGGFGGGGFGGGGFGGGGGGFADLPPEEAEKMFEEKKKEAKEAAQALKAATEKSEQITADNERMRQELRSMQKELERQKNAAESAASESSSKSTVDVGALQRELMQVKKDLAASREQTKEAEVKAEAKAKEVAQAAEAQAVQAAQAAQAAQAKTAANQGAASSAELQKAQKEAEELKQKLAKAEQSLVEAKKEIASVAKKAAETAADKEERESISNPTLGLGMAAKVGKMVKKAKDVKEERRPSNEADRSGAYSLSGKPIAVVEQELAEERKMRQQTEGQVKKLTEELEEAEQQRASLSKQLQEQGVELMEVKSQVEELYENEDKATTKTAEVQVFCKWVCRRYGTLESGFRSMDHNGNGLLSFNEFLDGLTAIGWLKVVGRRLFQVFDINGDGQISIEEIQQKLTDLEDGVEDADKAMGVELAQDRDQMVEERSEMQKKLAEALKAKDDLASEVQKMKEAGGRASVLKARANMLQAKDVIKQQVLERKVQALQDEVESLKADKDAMASKATAAMWKCRQDALQKDKAMRDLQQREEECKKIERKMALYKQRSNEESRTAFFSQPSARALSPTGASEDGPLRLQPLREGSPNVEAIVQETITVTTDETQTTEERITAAVVDDGGSSDAPGSMQTSPVGAAIPGGTSIRAGEGSRPPSNTGHIVCPKCGTALQKSIVRTSSRERVCSRERVVQYTTSSDDLGSLARSFPFAGQDQRMARIADSNQEESELPSAEQMAEMFDEDAVLAAAPRYEDIPYRLRIEAASGVTKKTRRWQLLYLDSEDRKRKRKKKDPTNPDRDFASIVEQAQANRLMFAQYKTDFEPEATTTPPKQSKTAPVMAGGPGTTDPQGLNPPPPLPATQKPKDLAAPTKPGWLETTPFDRGVPPNLDRQGTHSEIAAARTPGAMLPAQKEIAPVDIAYMTKKHGIELPEVKTIKRTIQHTVSREHVVVKGSPNKNHLQLVSVDRREKTEQFQSFENSPPLVGIAMGATFPPPQAQQPAALLDKPRTAAPPARDTNPEKDGESGPDSGTSLKPKLAEASMKVQTLSPGTMERDIVPGTMRGTVQSGGAWRNRRAEKRTRDDPGKPWEEYPEALGEPPKPEKVARLPKPVRTEPNRDPTFVDRDSSTPEKKLFLKAKELVQPQGPKRSRYLPQLDEVSMGMHHSASAPDLGRLKRGIHRPETTDPLGGRMMPTGPRTAAPAQPAQIETPFGSTSPHRPHVLGHGASHMVPRDKPHRKDDLNLVAGAFLLSTQVTQHATKNTGAPVTICATGEKPPTVRTLRQVAD